MVEYERWMEERDPAILDAIAAYNRDDCVSNLLLRDWLEVRRVEALADHPDWYPDGEVPRPGPEDGEPPPEARARSRPRPARREDALRDGVPGGPRPANAGAAGPLAAGGLLDWHRREASRSGGTTSGCWRRRWRTSSRDARRWAS